MKKSTEGKKSSTSLSSAEIERLLKEGEEKIKTYKVTIRGISPILMNPSTEELLNALEGGSGIRKPKDTRPTKEKAADKVIRNEKGEACIPVQYLFSCLAEAGRSVAYESKTKISTKESTKLPALIAIYGDFMPFLNQEAEWKVDRRKGRLPKDGTAVPIIRPRFDEWSFEVTVDVNEGKISLEKIIQLFKIAGTEVGLADFRPAKRGQFGRFKIEKWEEVSKP